MLNLIKTGTYTILNVIIYFAFKERIYDRSK